MPNLLGQSLGRYHILEQLGEGGMATVYKAYDTRLERDVAVKVIRVDQFAPAVLERILKRFEREAKSLARLSHPNIVGVIDYGEYEGVPYLVMEYLPGGSLKQRLGNPMPWTEAGRLLLPIARGLAYAHQRGVVHRDVKPSNILIGDSGEPMLTDFGIAKILEGSDAQTLTGTGIGVGTPEYMAPEQWTGQAGPQADIYSLGVVFYELVTGHKPYTADTPAAVLLKQASEPLPRPRQYAPDIPERAEQILLKALAKKPEDRYQSMGAMIAALEGLATASTSAKIKESAPKRESPAKPEKAVPVPVGHVGNLSTSGTNWKRWISIAALVAILGIGLALGGGLLKMGQQGQGPLAGLATDTVTPTLTSTSTLTLTPTKTPIPTAIITPTLAPGATQVSAKDGMVMVYVPAGEFLMGSTDSDTMAYNDEKPQHHVALDAYWMDRTEVTNAMYALCVQAGACQPPRAYSSSTRSNYYGNPQYDNYPVIKVNWNDADAYCSWAGARLPTEAEWDKAARGTNASVYPWGNNNPTCNLANLNPYGKSACVGDTSAVGAYPSGASPYGALDMAGNVWEWVNDWYGETYYNQSPSSNPTGPTSGQYRVLRGGTWSHGGGSVRTSSRDSFVPTNSYNFLGFRCSRGTSP